MKINILSNQSIQNLLFKKILSIISEYNQFLLAFSGGLDSTVLLDILSKIKIRKNFQLRAVYINHKINPYSDHWSLHCEKQCKYRDIPFKNIAININQNIKKNIEATLRSARYNALSSDLQLREVLLTAHHQNDQAETLMLALKRGSGPTGLSAMAMNTRFYNHRILRPLLYCKKEYIIQYAKKFQLKWINDDSNMNIQFDRNFLRLKVFPLLENRWPNFITTVSRSAQLCREQEELLDELLAETFTTLTQLNGSLSIQPLYTMSIPRRKYILRHWIAKYGNILPSSKQLDIIWNEVILSRCDANPVIYLDHKKTKKEIRRFRNYLYLLSTKNITPQQTLISWNNKSCYYFLPDNIGILFRVPIKNFDEISIKQKKEKKSIFPLCSISPLESIVRAPKIHENVFIRFGKVKGLLKIFERKHRCYLKKIWKEFNIPPWERPRIPLLFYNKSFIAAIGIFTINEEELVEKKYSKWKFYWIRNNYNN